MAIISALKILAGPAVALGRRWLQGKRDNDDFDRRLRLKVLENEASAMKYTQIRMSQSWTDDACVAWVLIFLTFCFVPQAQAYIAHGISVIENFPDWLQYIIIGAFTSSLGIASFQKYKRIK